MTTQLMSDDDVQLTTDDDGTVDVQRLTSDAGDDDDVDGCQLRLSRLVDDNDDVRRVDDDGSVLGAGGLTMSDDDGQVTVVYSQLRLQLVRRMTVTVDSSLGQSVQCSARAQVRDDVVQDDVRYDDDDDSSICVQFTVRQVMRR